jgi:hypothetical protein
MTARKTRDRSFIRRAWQPAGSGSNRGSADFGTSCATWHASAGDQQTAAAQRLCDPAVNLIRIQEMR